MAKFENEDFRPICVGDLINEQDKYNFLIPSFQRGYRWDRKQVEDLLNDLDRFINKNNTGSVYYLQPLIVCKKYRCSQSSIIEADGCSEELVTSNNTWYVLDGQQRLTTILLIIKNLCPYARQNFSNNALYTLKYQSRKNIDFDNPQKDLDINNYYVANTNQVIQEWIDIKKYKNGGQRSLERIIDTLFTQTPDDTEDEIPNSKYIKFIWFDTSFNKNNINLSNQIEIYNRFNSNKIKLTPSELIKALYVLKNDNQNDLSIWLNEWNNIEKNFMNDNFWHMLCKDDKQTRIDYLFDIIQGEIPTDPNKMDSAYRVYQEMYDNKQDFKCKWEEVKDYFSNLLMCYDDVKLYNYFGFLVYLGETTDKVYRLIFDNTNIDKNKNEKIEILQSEIKRKINQNRRGELLLDEDDFASLNYQDDKNKLKKFLLLYNIETCNKMNQKFNYSKFYNEKWELEHVSCQNGDFTKEEDKKEWLECAKASLILFPSILDSNNINIKQSMIDRCTALIEDLNNHRLTDANFKSFRNDTLDIFEPDQFTEDERHLISNLTLLDKSTNCGFGNSPFLAKRIYLMKNRILNGLFVPICTERVFMKYHAIMETSKDNNITSINLDMLHWTKEDKKYYFNDMVLKLKYYLS